MAARARLIVYPRCFFYLPAIPDNRLAPLATGSRAVRPFETILDLEYV